MTWWAILTIGGRHIATVESQDTPSASSCGIDMRGKTAVAIEHSPGDWERVAKDGSVVQDREGFARWAEAEIERIHAIPIDPEAARRDEYAIKEAEARSVLGGGDPGPILREEAADKDMDIPVLANAIVAAADRARIATAARAAARRRTIAHVRAAGTNEAIRAIVDRYRSANADAGK